MRTLVVSINRDAPEPDAIQRAAAILKSGGLVAFPTETVYGLGANALDSQAVARIFEAKGRPSRNPIIVHVAEAAAARPLVSDWPAAAVALTQRFWPGPLSIVLPKSTLIPDLVTAAGATVGLRAPGHPVAQALLAAAGVPLAAPSANRSSGLSPTLAEHVRRDLDGRIDMILDAGPTTGGIESTVLDLTVQPPRLLRPGLISIEALEAVIGPVAGGHTETNVQPGPLRSPGLMARHYAPRTPLEIVEGDPAERIRVVGSEGRRIGVITFAGTNITSAEGTQIYPMPVDPAAYAASLYAVLHVLDAAQLDRILVCLPPDEPQWLAIRDRLRRAASVE